MRVAAIGLGMLLVVGLATIGRTADGPAAQTMDLWPGEAPGDPEKGAIGEEQSKTKDGQVTSVTNVTKPTLTVSRPEKGKDTGVAIVVCPGGGYNNLAWEH